MRLLILATFLIGTALVGSRAADLEKSSSVLQTAPRAGTNAFKSVGVQEFEILRSAKTNVVLDVRTKREYSKGHIPGAIHIDVNAPDFEKKVAELDKNNTYLVHCGAGVRSAKACSKMRQLNFVDLYNLEGGLNAWEKMGNKLQR